MKRIIYTMGFMAAATFFGGPAFAQNYIADYSVAKEEVLRDIPEEYINAARTGLVVAYQHTSHGTHVSRGVAGLQDYKSGDEVLFGISASPTATKLEFRDYAMADYAPPGVDAADLSRDETAFIQTTRNYLDAPENSTVNVIMWSHCNIEDHDIAGNYLPGMETLINEYGPEGSKIGSDAGQRELPVTFIFMTGHANKNDNTGPLEPMQQAATIIDYCTANSQFCLDYYTIDTHTMDDVYYEDTGDNGDSDTYGGNFYMDWQNSHTLGVDYYENKRFPGGDVVFGEHNTQHITANRKAYAMWWILARIAGWDGDGTGGTGGTGGTSAVGDSKVYNDLHVYPNPASDRFFIDNGEDQIESVLVIDELGREVLRLTSVELSSRILVDLSEHSPGIYGIRVTESDQTVRQAKLILSK